MKNMSKQGIDGCTFIIESKWVNKPLVEIPVLKNSNGVIYAQLSFTGIRYKLFVCPAKYLRDTNEIPFRKEDFSCLFEMRQEIEKLLKKQFPKGYKIVSAKIEVNITDTMVGKCKCKDVFELFSNSLLHVKDQNMLYVTQSKECILENNVPGFVSRNVGNQWILKCYDKTIQLDIEIDVDVDKPLIRMEFILLSRKLHKLFGKEFSIKEIFSHSGMTVLINEYKALMDNLIDNHVKRYLSVVHRQLLEDLRKLKSPTDVYCLRKNNIHDKEQLRKVLKIWYEERGMNDNSNQVLQGLNKKFGLPSDTLKTVKKFHNNC